MHGLKARSKARIRLIWAANARLRIANAIHRDAKYSAERAWWSNYRDAQNFNYWAGSLEQ